ncbi:hypothetical protein LC605_19175 [Nostoc sp. CHAB 5836]|uniref:hypothetical protein n=1 Tax=Nostoc sp. CHAB 5836 TaxID=2780404 RepID=UPI001E28D823|nr:hypothetical protein [Nostoc sp. CHAB 5836]MCC5617164.1 hypothetical protein [Nostoc sp. CHAB 5836]
MSNINNLTSVSNNAVVGQEQLFTELTLEEGAVIEGGLRFNLGNKSDIEVNYDINGIKGFLNPDEEKTYSFFRAPTVSFDSKIGSGVVLKRVKLVPGNNNFDRIGKTLILGTGGGGFPAPNIVPNTSA